MGKQEIRTKVLLTNVKGKGYLEDAELDRRKY